MVCQIFSNVFQRMNMRETVWIPPGCRPDSCNVQRLTSWPQRLIALCVSGRWRVWRWVPPGCPSRCWPCTRCRWAEGIPGRRRADRWLLPPWPCTPCLVSPACWGRSPAALKCQRGLVSFEFQLVLTKLIYQLKLHYNILYPQKCICFFQKSVKINFFHQKKLGIFLKFLFRLPKKCMKILFRTKKICLWPKK